MYESTDKMVSHPDHYQGKNGMEVIDVIEAFTADLKGIEATDTANIIKYACRWKNKGGVQDLEKIIWYAQHLVDKLKAEAAAHVFSDKKNEELIKGPKVFSKEELCSIYSSKYAYELSLEKAIYIQYIDDNAIRLEFEDGRRFIFRYYSEDSFSLVEIPGAAKNE